MSRNPARRARFTAVPRPAAPEPRGWTAPLLVAITLVPLLVLAAYVRTLPYDFQFDDLHTIRDNSLLDHLRDPGSLWRHRPSRFVLSLSFAANVALTGKTPAGLRAVNLLVHIGASLLVGWIGTALARRLGPAGPETREARAAAAWTGTIAALLFAVHPMATQAVTYIYQRATSLTALWELAAVACYLRARGGGGARWWVASWVAGLLAALTKEMSVALPLLILAIEAVLRRPAAPDRTERPPRWAWFAPYLAIVPLVAMLAGIPSGEEGAPPGLREAAHISRSTYLLTQLVVVPRYLRLIAWPRGQNVDHDAALHPGLDGAVLLGAGVLVLATVAAWRIRRRQPLVWLGWAWFGTALLPESSVIPITDVMFEHRTYLPLAGLAWGAGGLLAAYGTAGGRWRWLLPAAIVGALAVTTGVRNRVWSDPVTLWTDVTARSPGKPRGYNNLGFALEERGRPDEAMRAYARAVAADSSYLEGLLNLARLRGTAGDFRGALALQSRAERLMPYAPEIQNDLGTTWWGLGDTARAATCYARALEFSARALQVSPRGSQVLPTAGRAAANLARLRSGRALLLAKPVSPAEAGAKHP